MRKILLFPVFFVLFVTAAAARLGDNAPVPVTGPEEAFMAGAVVVKGEGAAPEGAESEAQRRLMALRAAKVAALREAAEIIDGVAISGETTVVNAMSESDTVYATVQGLVRGAQVAREDYDPSSGTAVVYVSVPMTGPNGLIGALLPQVAPMYPFAAPPYLPQSGVAPQGGYDGLIIDVRGQPFRPALINRVLAEGGEVVYDPSSVSGGATAPGGSAGYTEGIARARELLAERGSANPLVVKAGVVNSTDVRISSAEADAVFSSNRSNSFLEGGKVVFVLR